MSFDRPGPAARLVEAARTSSAIALELLETRLALLANDIELELARVRSSLALLIAAMASAGLALALVVFLVVAAFWDTHRLLAIGASALVLAAAAVLFAIGLRRRVASGAPFAATLHELRADCRALRGDDE